jgi:hypothetical protein
MQAETCPQLPQLGLRRRSDFRSPRTRANRNAKSLVAGPAEILHGRQQSGPKDVERRGHAAAVPWMPTKMPPACACLTSASVLAQRHRHERHLVAWRENRCRANGARGLQRRTPPQHNRRAGDDVPAARTFARKNGRDKPKNSAPWIAASTSPNPDGGLAAVMLRAQAERLQA